MNSEEELRRKVQIDIKNHKEGNWCLNPFSTVGSRASWQRGFEGKEPLGHAERMECYERGKAAAKLISAAIPWTVKIWDGFSNNYSTRTGTYEQVRRSLAGLPPGYIWSIEPS